MKMLRRPCKICAGALSKAKRSRSNWVEEAGRSWRHVIPKAATSVERMDISLGTASSEAEVGITGTIEVIAEEVILAIVIVTVEDAVAVEVVVAAAIIIVAEIEIAVAILGAARTNAEETTEGECLAPDPVPLALIARIDGDI